MEQLGELFGAGLVLVWLGLVIVAFVMPFFVIWATLRALGLLARIADALEVRERESYSSLPLPPPTVGTEVVGGIQRITNSAFGR